MTDDEKYKFNKKVDACLLLSTVSIFVCSLISLYVDMPALSWLSITLADIYLFAILLVSAIRADKKNSTYNSSIEVKYLFPSRWVGVFLIPIIFITIVVSFAGLYLSVGGSESFNKEISEEIDTIYYSLVTITTLGYGDIYPVARYAKVLVISELLSGALLLFGVFPLLISRISDFSE